MYDFKNKKVLVTGASGFLGDEVVNRLLKSEAEVHCMARNEGNLIKLQMKYPQITKVWTGNVSDRFSVQQAIKGIDYIFHYAQLT